MDRVYHCVYCHNFRGYLGNFKSGGDRLLINGWIAPKRQGKTLGMTTRLYRAHLAGKQVYSNYWLNFPFRRVDAGILKDMATDEIELANCALGVDEVHIVIDPRTSMTARTRTISYLLTQTGKRNVDFHYTTQHERQIEIRLWNNSEYLVYAKKLRDGVFYYRVVYGPSGHAPGRLKGRFILHGKQFYNLYDTAEIIKDALPAHAKESERAKRPEVSL